VTRYTDLIDYCRLLCLNILQKNHLKTVLSTTKKFIYIFTKIIQQIIFIHIFINITFSVLMEMLLKI